MFEIPKLGDEDNQYDGSRIFTWLADICGLSVDLINFLVCQILALFFASFFRSYLHTSKVTTNIRHAFGLTLGLYFGYFCFGQQAIHIVGLPAVCYIIIRTQNPQIVQRLVMVVSLIYLSLVHLHRIYFDYGSYSLDITGPLMVITQKVTLLTFSIHDGIARNENDLTKSQKCHAVRTLPSALEYFAYVLQFQSLMAGPLVFYKDYMEFIEGTNILKHTNANGNLDKNSKAIVVEPSPTKAVVKKVIGSVVCAYIFMNWVKVYPIKTLADDGFVESASFGYKLWYMMMATTVVRFKYYHAWLLSDAICNNSGLGFNGYEKDGNPKWDLISNINVISFELATNLRDAISNWNMGTNQWLRMIVYERVPKKYGTILTFMLSALWHGFYPGYYITFASGALIVTAARTARKLFRHRLQHSEHSRIFYDILTVLTTRIFMGYLTFPFILLEFKASLHLYLNIFMCLHLVGVITIYVLPTFIRGVRSQQRATVSTANETTATITIPSDTPNGKQHVPATKIANGVLHHTESNGWDAIKSTAQPSKRTENVKKITEEKTNEKLCDININGKLNTVAQNDDSNAMATANSYSSSLTPIDGSAMISDHHSITGNFNTNSCSKLRGEETDDFRRRKSMENHLSMKIRERIDSETRNIEEFIDKTVTGIVELKDDLMRPNGDELYLNTAASNASKVDYNRAVDDGLRKRNNNSDLTPNGNDVEAFLRKEINISVNQVNVLPAVLSNGHGD